MSIELGISGAIGLLFGSVLAWLVLRSRTAGLQARFSLMEKELLSSKADLARLLEDQKKLLESRARLESFIKRIADNRNLSYAQRYYFNTLVSRFTSYRELWRRTLRAKGDELV